MFVAHRLGTPMRVRARSQNVVRYLGYIAANTRILRLQRELTQERLAEKADLDLRFVQRIERGATNLSVAVLISLSEALGVVLTAFFKPAKLMPSKPGRPRKTAPRASKKKGK